jgi:hypothetical protein
MLLLASAAVATVACFSEGVGPSTGLAVGTWGGDGAGVIVSDTLAHVHVGCTYGNFELPGSIDRNGRFESTGSDVLRAYPIAVGPSLPARMQGTIDGRRLTFIVTVNDTVQGGTTVLGPKTVVLGDDPRLGPCPICAVIPSLEAVPTGA